MAQETTRELEAYRVYLRIRKGQLTAEYSGIYSNQKLADALNELENSFSIVNRREQFEKTVSVAVSKDQPYHRWARYREAYSNELVRDLIRRSGLDSRLHFTFDPMCGSGSTLVASAEMGFDSLGCDVNAYAVDLTNAKTHFYKKNELVIVEKLINKPPSEQSQLSLSTWRNVEQCAPYFKPKNLHQLQIIRDLVERTHQQTVKHLLFVAWLTILEDCSDKMKDGNGLASRPSRVNDVWERFTTRLQFMLEDLRKYPLPEMVMAEAYRCSALKSSPLVKEFGGKTEKKLGAIIFSPPYANSFDYFESYKLELLCGYYNTSELIEARQHSIRNYRKGYGHDLETDDPVVGMLCQEIRNRIPQKEAASGTKDNRSRLVPNLLIGYFKDMETAICEFSNSMPSGSFCHIVVDQSSYLGVVIPTDLLLANVAQRHGFKIQEIAFCRTAKTSGQQIRLYPHLRTTLRGSIVSLKKV
ncbi:hypothetical protein ACFLU8_02410 [Chloroflexota bacterium]